MIDQDLTEELIEGLEPLQQLAEARQHPAWAALTDALNELRDIRDSAASSEEDRP